MLDADALGRKFGRQQARLSRAAGAFPPFRPVFEPGSTVLPAKAKVIAVADKIIGADGPVGVVDDNGAIVGTITADAILPVLLERS